MRKLEDLMNWMTDMDWGWWPVLSMRPPKDGDMDNRVLLKISPIFGSVAGLILYFLRPPPFGVEFKLEVMAFFVLAGWVAFYALYKVTFAYFWNCRAGRLRSAAAENAAMAQLTLFAITFTLGSAATQSAVVAPLYSAPTDPPLAS
ncbi:MAG: hypothetical protein ABMA26_15430 [Limisphaerales bacterium]